MTIRANLASVERWRCAGRARHRFTVRPRGLTARRCASGSWWLAAVLLTGSWTGGCGGGDDLPETGILLVVDADAELRATVRRLEIDVESWSASGERVRPAPTVFKGLTADDWPRRGRLVPRDGDASRQFLVTVRAYELDECYAGSCEPLATVRAQSGYVAGQWRRLVLFLVSSCRGVTCDVDQTCRAGRCESAEVPPGQLDVYDEAGRWRRAGDGADGSVDGATDGGPDAGTDGAADAAPDAAPEGGMDAAADAASDAGMDAASDGAPEGGMDAAADAAEAGTGDAAVSCAVPAECPPCGACEQVVCRMGDAGGVCGCDPAPEGTACGCGDGVGFCRMGRCFRTFETVEAGARHTCAVDAAGALRCWGDNGSGQVGVSGAFKYPLPQVVDPAPDIDGETLLAVRLGGQHTCAVIDDPTAGVSRLTCWGENGSGQLGLGDRVDRPAPTEVTGLLDASRGETSWRYLSMDLGAATSCVAMEVTAGDSSDYRVRCWGANDRWQVWGWMDPAPAPDYLLPNNSFADTASFGPIAMGDDFTVLVKMNGSVWGWGDDRYDQLGASGGRSPPRMIGGFDAALGALRRVVAGGRHACVLGSNERVGCWGANGSGQLGRDMTGSSGRRAQPVTGLPPVYAFVAGGRHTCVATEDGMGARRVHCWGDNGFGQLGTGDTTGGEMPRAVPALDGALVQSLAAGEAHTCAVVSPGRLYCWGDNRSGQLGQGDLTSRSEPTEVLIACPPG